MRTRTLLLLSVFLPVVSLYAQKKKVSKREILTIGTRFVRFNFPGMIDPVETNLSGGFEYRFSERFSLATDLGWVFYSRYFQNAKTTNGFLVRPSIRWYPDENDNVFCEAELHYKQVNYKIYDWLGKDCVNDVPAYEELTNFKYRRELFGIAGKGGYQEKITRNGRLWFEIYAGVGVRWVREIVVNEPNSCYDRTGNFLQWGARETDENDNNKRVVPILPGGFRLLFRLN